MTAAPLVLVTRPSGTADPLAAALAARGYRVAAVPTVVTSPALPGGELDRALASIEDWNWVVVTSAAGAHAVRDAVMRVRAGSPIGDKPRWAAVGPATAAALEAGGIHVDVTPGRSSGLGIAQELADRSDLAGSRILLARADAASADLPDALRAAGADVHEAVAYRTLEAPPDSAAAVAEALADGNLAAIVVASGSAVRGLLALASTEFLSVVLATPLISVGPSTTAVARKFGLTTIVEASQPSTEALVDAVDSILRSRVDAAALAGRPA